MTGMISYYTTALRVRLQRFNIDERAVTAIEYALISALIAVVIISAVSELGKNVSKTFKAVSSEL